jgi:small subunit ribosomal protein S21
MSYVEIRLTGDDKKDKALFEVGLREFKKRMKKSGILNDMRRKEFYMRPSIARRYKKNEAIKRRKREENKQIRTENYE